MVGAKTEHHRPDGGLPETGLPDTGRGTNHGTIRYHEQSCRFIDVQLRTDPVPPPDGVQYYVI